MNRPALRHAGRSFPGWFLTTITAAYAWASDSVGTPLVTTLTYVAFGLVLAALFFSVRYTDSALTQQRVTADAKYQAERAGRQRELAAYMAQADDIAERAAGQARIAAHQRTIA